MVLAYIVLNEFKYQLKVVLHSMGRTQDVFFHV